MMIGFGGTNGQLLFAFEAAGEIARWRPVNDGVMGGVSQSRVEAGPEGGMIFSGVVSLENNGGFASVRSTGPVFDLEDYSGIILRVRGDGQRYKLSLNSSEYWLHPGFNAPFATSSGEWQEVRLPFADFRPTRAGGRWPGTMDTRRITTVGLLIADKQAGPFRLEIDWIGAYQ